ncbi:MAG: ribosome maturation factor RimM [Candidatus Cryptobacteroides sp.]
MKGFRQIARVLKSNGTDGELVLGFRDIMPEDIDLKEPVFICFDELPVPFFIDSFVKKGNSKANVRLTDICSMEDAEEVAGKAVWAESRLYEPTMEEDGFKALVGWTLYRPEGEYDVEVGEIIEFVDIPGNPCIEVETENGEVMVPLHEDLILAADPESREIVIDIPEGLF